MFGDFLLIQESFEVQILCGYFGKGEQIWIIKLWILRELATPKQMMRSPKSNHHVTHIRCLARTELIKSPGKSGKQNEKCELIHFSFNQWFTTIEWIPCNFLSSIQTTSHANKPWLGQCSRARWTMVVVVVQHPVRVRATAELQVHSPHRSLSRWVNTTQGISCWTLERGREPSVNDQARIETEAFARVFAGNRISVWRSTFELFESRLN